ncbi:MAG: hypothetical protein JWQ81_8037 [Amycolatopsis sp.]|jgi:hypothetical protein|uniref:hypothetical protein n=1 Tax=Amycolatopsis sp. TaxID=37632 RepID=UPI00262EF99E|nr:hypothetical protein [Amycolatopsis sp.]MCU1687298.1 hypothetical protein [Amycolatopsis sp.]
MNITPVTTRDYEARRAPLTAAPTKVNEIKVKETAEMLLHEELSKARIRDLEEDIRACRQYGNLRAVRRWQRISQWAARRAHRYER